MVVGILGKVQWRRGAEIVVGGLLRPYFATVRDAIRRRRSLMVGVVFAVRSCFDVSRITSVCALCRRWSKTGQQTNRCRVVSTTSHTKWHQRLISPNLANRVKAVSSWEERA